MGGCMDDRLGRVVRVMAGARRESRVEFVWVGLCAAVLAHWADDVVGGRRADVAHAIGVALAVLGDVVFLRIVFYLWWG